ncbi:DUF3014 domain-containing protein [Ramlibacter sp. AN1015]|uniref:DUF3014 domain-containing protein n=1 Tax=Ramlibacter sp. AN1015 TaxID=3133428 RepID=UPI0030C444BF
MARDEDFRRRPDEPYAHRSDARPRPRVVVLVAAALLLLALGITWLWWTRGGDGAPAAPGASTTPATTAPVATGPRFPIEEGDPAAAPQNIESAITDLVGRPAAAALLNATDFPRRFVATVDALGREHATSLLWPVLPTAGRFDVRAEPGGKTAVISPANAARYRPFVAMAERIDPQRTAQLYRSIYPRLQQAYRDLGFTGYFNDRTVEVIDLLLATPEPQGPVELRQPERKEPGGDPRTWVRWQFADEELQSLTAGQKVLVRMGVDNQRRLKRTLTELRRELATVTADAAAQR